jgi:hypothetical protein
MYRSVWFAYQTDEIHAEDKVLFLLAAWPSFQPIPAAAPSSVPVAAKKCGPFILLCKFL